MAVTDPRKDPARKAPATLASLLDEGRALLGTDADAMIDLRQLVTGISGIDRARQIIDPEQPLSEAAATRLRRAFYDRAKGIPVAYILGTRGFWRHDFRVTPDTLIPRPETEILLEWALELLSVDDQVTVADLGTGSGILAVCLAVERPRAMILASDLSAGALKVARENQQTIVPSHPIHWFQGNWADCLADESLDMIVSNPPYIPDDDPHLSTGDLRYEPRTALAAGFDGLNDYRVLFAEAVRVLKPGGHILVEHGFDQSAAILALLTQVGFTSLITRSDCAGLPRTTGGHKPGR